MSRWQIMPLTPTGFGDSPYASPSAFAGNPNLISLEWLAGDGLLAPEDLIPFHQLPAERVDFSALVPMRRHALSTAFRTWREHGGDDSDDFLAFIDAESTWLDDFCLYSAISDENDGRSWSTWDDELRFRDADALVSAKVRLNDGWYFHAFLQYRFRQQWQELKRYANQRGIEIIGDIPIFVAYDSSDVWANQMLFQLDSEGRPHTVAGVPPDYFSADGQLWGNPAYDWDAVRRTGFRWWIERIRTTFQLVDIARVDHFRGLVASWNVPADAETARDGRWVPGPGKELFEAISVALGDVKIVVEDLGIITPDVHLLRRELGFPGMKVLQFAFDGDPKNAYLPHTFDNTSVVFTGTHDNDTTLGWFHNDLGWDAQERVRAYLGRDGSDIAWDLIRLGFSSVADLAIVPLQDVLRLGSDARMNVPGAPMGNWSWRFTEHQLDAGHAAGIRQFAALYDRIPSASRTQGFDPFDYTAPGTAHPLHQE
jgi:4-alpha-glucanotransferase